MGKSCENSAVRFQHDTHTKKDSVIKVTQLCFTPHYYSEIWIF